MPGPGDSAISTLISSNGGKLVLYVEDKEYPGHAQLDTVINSLKEDFPSIRFETVDLASAREALAVDGSPTFVFFQGQKEINRLEGCSTSMLVTTIRGWDKSDSGESTQERIKRLISTHRILLFMKGEKSDPFCRYSKAVVNMLNESGVEYDTYNIFEDPELREELKVYSNWPTYPQLYVNGSLIGGHDIIKELYEQNSLRFD
ncbi:Glutaredoxin family protein [Babesia bovis T2Bo]|uniref:Thioredoxin-like protein 2 n=1 Tax=Babesia bovis TaxID=5865 RepID=A7AUS5_BABBO|nr:Glutaredoxin family protein [Babesia bovis T2Bo]EDO06686.1 Glutaredoxin family protein [Babesia bovis T2Bo]|eukprot:XP_001610254.1 Thioredoxin-like protein 2 [Babesia bovis T2Bo]